MGKYFVHFMTHGGKVFGSERFAAGDDQSAVEYARTRLKSPFGKGHEIWQGDRLVHQEDYKSPMPMIPDRPLKLKGPKLIASTKIPRKLPEDDQGTRALTMRETTEKHVKAPPKAKSAP